MGLIDRFGFEPHEIDSSAREVLQILTDMDLPPPLMLLALCKAITVIATDEELDIAAQLLDEFKEDNADSFDDIFDEDTADEDEWESE